MTYHILNGDALKERFPKSIAGHLIVARECLVDGEVKGSTLPELYATRARFLSHAYGEGNEADYYVKVVTEFDKIKAIPKGASIYLWFEDDLFCQVNSWFVMYLLKEFNIDEVTVHWVRPTASLRYGFGGMDTEALQTAFQAAQQIDQADRVVWQELWPLYQQMDIEKMKTIGEELQSRFPFVATAIQAQAERLPHQGKEGRPTQTLLQIMEELNTRDFGPVFRAFCEKESIYGFGDLQVKRLLDTITE